jgi:hypothetical protein
MPLPDHHSTLDLINVLKKLDLHFRATYTKVYGKLDRKDELEELFGNMVNLPSATEAETLRDLSPDAPVVYRELCQLDQHHVTQADADAVVFHPLFWFCARLEERLGGQLDRDGVAEAARRLNTEIGLRPYKGQTVREDGSHRELPDLLWLGGGLGQLDESGVTAKLLCEFQAAFPEVAAELGFTAASLEKSPLREAAGTRRKRSTAKGEAETKLIAGLTTFHGYVNGGCERTEPAGVRPLARICNVSPSSAFRFYENYFDGFKKYRTLCQTPARLSRKLQTMNEENIPRELRQSLLVDPSSDA